MSYLAISGRWFFSCVKLLLSYTQRHTWLPTWSRVICWKTPTPMTVSPHFPPPASHMHWWNAQLWLLARKDIPDRLELWWSDFPDQSSLGLNRQFCTLADGHHKKNQQKEPQRGKQTLRSARMLLPQTALLKGWKERKERKKKMVQCAAHFLCHINTSAFRPRKLGEHLVQLPHFTLEDTRIRLSDFCKVSEQLSIRWRLECPFAISCFCSTWTKIVLNDHREIHEVNSGSILLSGWGSEMGTQRWKSWAVKIILESP